VPLILEGGNIFMNLALIGYGKMGKEIEKTAISRGHKINLIIDINNPQDLTLENLRKCDVAIEFTIPHSAVNNYYICFEAGIPLVSGTTGWLDKKEEVVKKCTEMNGTFFYASNFSVGVNLFFETILSTMLRLLKFITPKNWMLQAEPQLAWQKIF
jgi:4-hydroxy-tetrahydrodipicolinate reductase